MQQRPSICKKYKILQFQSDFLVKTYQNVPNEAYLLSKKPNQSIRKYKIASGFTQNMIQLNDWRSDTIPQVIHCYFLQLKHNQKEQQNRIECEMYVQHMEATLKDMKKLMIQQSFYVIIEAIKAYQELFMKFQRITVNFETIGLNAVGQCVVWINRNLDQTACQQQYIDEERLAIKTLIQLIIQRNQPKSQIILKRIIDFISKKKLNLDEILNYVINLSKNIKINIPLNLKYLVSQFRIVKQVEIFKSKNINEVKNQPIENMKQIKSARKRPSFKNQSARKRPSYKENVVPSPKDQQIGSFKQNSPKMRFLNDSQLKIIAKLQTPFAGLVIKKKHIVDQQIPVCNYNFPKRFSYMQSKFEKNSTKGMISIAETKQSNSKTTTCNSNFSSIVIPVNDIMKTESKQEPNIKKTVINQYKFSKSLQKLQQKNTMITSKATQRAKSVKFGHRGRVSKSNVDNNPIMFKDNKYIFEQCEQDQSSPKQQTTQKDNQLLLLNQFDKLQTKELTQVQNQHKLMLQNNWTANINSDRFWSDNTLGKSINLEQSQLNGNYLQDVKLQRLDMLHKQITISIIAHQSRC